MQVGLVACVAVVAAGWLLRRRRRLLVDQVDSPDHQDDLEDLYAAGL